MSSRPPTLCGNFHVCPDNTWMPRVTEHSFCLELSSSMTGFHLESKSKFCSLWANKAPFWISMYWIYALFLRHTEWICFPFTRQPFRCLQTALIALWRILFLKIAVLGSHKDSGAMASTLAHLNRPPKVFWAMAPPTGQGLNYDKAPNAY